MYTTSSSSKFVLDVKIDPKIENFDFATLMKDAEKKTVYSYSYSHSESHSVTLESCFEAFSQTETLDENNQWYCDNCKVHVCANKTNQIWSVPECLIIHLKRFSSGLYSMVQKDGTNVEYDDEIDISKFLVGPQKKGVNKYRLYAVSEHMGGMGGGHYVAHALVVNPLPKGNTEEGEWYSFNDSSASRSSSSDAHNSSAYVLFYRKVQ